MKKVSFLSIRLLVAVLVLSMLVLLVSCSEPKPQQEGAKADDQVNLTFLWWGGDARNQATYAAMDAYMAKHPNVKIEGQTEAWDTYYEKLLTQLVGNSTPDIVQLDYSFVPDLVNQGKPFVDMLTLDGKIDLSGFDLEFAKSYGGGSDYLIGLPTGINGICVIYNVELAKKLGIDMSKSDTWTFEDLITVGQQVNQKDSGKYFMYFKKELEIILVKTMLKQMNGHNLINDDYTLGFTRDEMIEIFQYIRRLVDTKTIPPFEIGTVYENQIADNPDWLNERYVMTGTYASLIGTFMDASPFEIDSTRFFVMDNPVDKGVPATPTNILGISKKSKNVDAAADFLNWFYNDEEAIDILGDVRGVPPVAKAREQLEKNGKIREQISKGANYALEWTGEPDNSISLNTEITNRLLDFIHEVGYNRMTPEQATDALMEALQQILKTLKK